MIIHLLPLINKKKIILGSSSPRRISILKELGLNFLVIKPFFEENLDKTKFKNSIDYVIENSKQKAKEINNRLSLNEEEKPDLIISADTVVSLDNKILEKPKSFDEALQMLNSLSGREHFVYSGVSLLFPKLMDPVSKQKPWIYSFYEQTEVIFDQLTLEMIQEYIKTGIPMDKAGSYGIQDSKGGSFVKKINGCCYNVIGFPLNKFCRELLYIIKTTNFL